MNVTAAQATGVVLVCGHCGQKNRVAYSALGKEARCGKCKNELPAIAASLHIEEPGSFQALVQQSDLPVLVDFWASWCGPCKMMAPEVEKVAAGANGKFVVAKVNTEEHPAISQQFQISSLPTLALFANGREVSRTEGARPAAQIRGFVELHLGR